MLSGVQSKRHQQETGIFKLSFNAIFYKPRCSCWGSSGLINTSADPISAHLSLQGQERTAQDSYCLIELPLASRSPFLGSHRLINTKAKENKATFKKELKS